jgi:hypothetical protein
MLTDPILLDHDGDVHPPCGRWLARAEQARRIARILSSTDAEIAEAYAIECEVQALRQVSERCRRGDLAA